MIFVLELHKINRLYRELLFSAKKPPHSIDWFNSIHWIDPIHQSIELFCWRNVQSSNVITINEEKNEKFSQIYPKKNPKTALVVNNFQFFFFKYELTRGVEKG